MPQKLPLSTAALSAMDAARKLLCAADELNRNLEATVGQAAKARDHAVSFLHTEAARMLDSAAVGLRHNAPDHDPLT